MGPASSRKFTAGRSSALLLAAVASCATCLAAETDPHRFPLTDRGPLNGLLGLPDGWTRHNGPAAELAWDIANNAMGQQSAHESLLLDGETQTVTLRWQRAFGDRLSLGLELPWMAHGGGFLDRSIDAWHDTLGLSEGIRPELPTGNLRYVYARDGERIINLEDATSGIGDVRTSGAWRLGTPGPGRLAFEVTADIKWPTGDARRLTGSGSTDVAAGLRLVRPPGQRPDGPSRLSWSAQAGIVWPGHVDQPLPAPSAQVYYYDAALAWAATPTLDLILQAQGHTGAWQSDLKMLGTGAAQLGGGALWHLAGGYSLRLGLFEDIRTDTTPDVTLELALVLRGSPGPGVARRP